MVAGSGIGLIVSLFSGHYALTVFMMVALLMSAFPAVVKRLLTLSGSRRKASASALGAVAGLAVIAAGSELFERSDELWWLVAVLLVFAAWLTGKWAYLLAFGPEDLVAHLAPRVPPATPGQAHPPAGRQRSNFR